MGADRAGDEGQSVLFGNQLQRLVIEALAAELDVFRDVLLDRAAAFAGSLETVEPGHGILGLPGRKRLDRFDVVIVRMTGLAHVRNSLCVRPGEGGERQVLHLFAHLDQTVVAAGLEDRGGHGDGPDPGAEEPVAVEVLRAAGEGDLHLSSELPGDPAAHLDGQREEGAAGHVHLVVGQLTAGRVDREGVGELEAELYAGPIGQSLEPLEHRDGVLPLQVLVEVVLVEHDVIIAHGIQGVAGGAVAEDRRVALDEGVDLLFGDQVGGDPLDLIGRAAVEGGEGDRP